MQVLRISLMVVRILLILVGAYLMIFATVAVETDFTSVSDVDLRWTCEGSASGDVTCETNQGTMTLRTLEDMAGLVTMAILGLGLEAMAIALGFFGRDMGGRSDGGSGSGRLAAAAAGPYGTTGAPTAHSPQQTPQQTPYQAPQQTPQHTPYQAPQQTPHQTPYQAPQQPYQAPGGSGGAGNQPPQAPPTS